MTKGSAQGFTLIELSIVLVIIGLIAGGVLVGQTLIGAARVRATITQIEKYNTAANTFFGKYGYLPGDIPAALVAQLGFTAAPGRTGTAGLGNGDGLIDGYNASQPAPYPVDHTLGEAQWFWEDLSTNSGLIEGGFNTGTATNNYPCCLSGYTGTYIDEALPAAKLGNGNYISINESGSKNYFTISGITAIYRNIGDTYSNPGITSLQAYAIDSKLDDGNPQTGRITAQYANLPLSANAIVWAAGGGVQGALPGTAATPSSTTCYDNGGNASNPMAYSLSQNGGAGVNCALSFRMQAGD